MDTGIGATLREARNRRKVDLSEVEAAIKIRVRYLQAMENEEWDALPGGAYTRGFIRTYASYLGLDGERLADDYRRATGPPGGERAPKRVEPVPTARRAAPAPRSPAASSSRPSASSWSLSWSASPSPEAAARLPRRRRRATARRRGRSHAQAPATASKPGVAVRLTATAEVWVCLLDAKEQPLVDGQILEEGDRSRPVPLQGLRSRPGQRLGDDVRRRQAGRSSGKLQPGGLPGSIRTAS